MEQINSLINYKKFIKTQSNEIINIHGDEYSNSSMYAYYVHKILGLHIDQESEPYYQNKIDTIYELKEFELDSNGIYSFYIESNTEIHYFVLVITGAELTLLSVYSGQYGIINKKFNKSEWLNKFKHLFLLNNTIDNKEKIKIYSWLFGLEQVFFNELSINSFNIEYTFLSK